MKRISAIAVLVALTASCRATDRLVPQQYPTIQAAVHVSGTGDTVIVSPGTYVEEVRVWAKTGLTIRSIDPDDDAIVASTIISSGAARRTRSMNAPNR